MAMRGVAERRRRRWMYAAMTALVAVVVVGCESSASGGPARQQGPLSIKVGVATGTGPLNADIAVAKGYFKRHGLDVHLQVLNGAGAEGVAALQSGSLDVVESNIGSVIEGSQHGIITPCFAGGVKYNDELNVPLEARPEIQRASQLVGKKVAVVSTNSANQILVDAYLQANHVDYRTVSYIAMGIPNMMAAMKNGAVDAALIGNPWATQWEQEGGTVLAVNLGKYVGSPDFACWIASKSWLDRHKETARAFIAGLNDADAYFVSHRREADAAASQLAGIPASTLDQQGTWDYTTAISASDIQKWFEAGKRFGIFHGSINMKNVYEPV
jgi:NitT/TauT family transport system substrate-binding protein